MGLGAYYANLEPSWATHSTPNPTTAPQEPPGDEQTGLRYTWGTPVKLKAYTQIYEEHSSCTLPTWPSPTT